MPLVALRPQVNELGADVTGAKKEVDGYLRTSGSEVQRLESAAEHGISAVRDKVRSEAARSARSLY